MTDGHNRHTLNFMIVFFAALAFFGVNFVWNGFDDVSRYDRVGVQIKRVVRRYTARGRHRVTR